MDPKHLERAKQMVGIDPFIKQVTDVVPGWLHPGNIWCFRHALVNLMSDAPLLEIGSYAGLSTVVLLHLKRKFGIENSLFTCDPWTEPEGPADDLLAEGTSLTFGQMRDFVRDRLVRNVARLSPEELPASFRMTSDDFFRDWKTGSTCTDLFGRAQKLGGTLAFVYVDGSHKYSFAKRDFEHIHECLESGGFILFDDSGADATGGPARVANEVAAMAEYQLIHRAPNALFQKRR